MASAKDNTSYQTSKGNHSDTSIPPQAGPFDQTVGPQTQKNTSHSKSKSSKKSSKSTPEMPKVGYNILKGELCSTEFPTFDFDLPGYDAHETLRKHQLATQELAKTLAIKAEFWNHYPKSQIPDEPLCNKWMEETRGLFCKAIHWATELEKLGGRVPVEPAGFERDYLSRIRFVALVSGKRMAI
ncbi:MAG: hypothetical protein Q9168_006798 [Polycauliona sp. 1 TL-2023]